MKTKLLLSFLAVVLMSVVMRWQGMQLISPASPRGIIDLEFARTPERLRELQLFMDLKAVWNNIYLDFVFIAAYVWFFVTACSYIRSRTAWARASGSFSSLGITAGLFDVAENFLLMLILEQRFQPSLLQVVYYIALLKFIFAGMVVLYLLFSWPFALRRRLNP